MILTLPNEMPVMIIRAENEFELNHLLKRLDSAHALFIRDFSIENGIVYDCLYNSIFIQIIYEKEDTKK